MYKWISVKDQLPEEDLVGNFLCSVKQKDGKYYTQTIMWVPEKHREIWVGT